MRLPERLQPDLSGRGMGQVLGRGLAPRLSTGTLQLSIRCSSIHFLPSRSFPVSGVGNLNSKARLLRSTPADQGVCLEKTQAR